MIFYDKKTQKYALDTDEILNYDNYDYYNSIIYHIISNLSYNSEKDDLIYENKNCEKIIDKYHMYIINNETKYEFQSIYNSKENEIKINNAYLDILTYKINKNNDINRIAQNIFEDVKDNK